MRLMGTFPALKGAANRSIFSFPLLSKAAAATTTTTRNYSKTTDGKHAPEEVDALSINEFHRISEDYLELLTDHLVDLGQDFPQVDAEYSVSNEYE
jgi:protoheme ferro-lyase